MTAQDVARAAGVSPTTVSFVVNNAPGHSISEDTRRRVLDVVKELGYTPHSAARALRRGRNDTVLLVMPDLPLASTVARFVDALSVGLAERDLSLLVRRPRADETPVALSRSLSPAAVISIGGFDPGEDAAMRGAGIVSAAILLEAPVEARPCVVVSQFDIGRMQVEHLLERGCHRIAYLAPVDSRLAGIADARIAGARHACADQGMPTLDVRRSPLTVEGVRPAVDDWSRSDGPRTGVVSYNDDFGGAILAALHSLGRNAPGDLGVIGVDNDTMSAFSSPPMTTVDQLPEEVGARLAAITAAEIGVVTDLPVPDAGSPCVVVRSST